VPATKEGEKVTETLQLKRYRGLLVRPGVRLDEFAAEETTWRRFTELLTPDDTLLDIGAYIGSFAVNAAREQGTHTIAYEPFPEHFEVMLQNAQDLPIECRQVAVMGEAGTVTLYLAPKSPMAHSTVEKKRSAGMIEVQAVSFSDELERYKPTAIKVDIEGAEYTFLNELKTLPIYIKKIALEFHLVKDEKYLTLARETIDILTSQGWEFIIGPRTGGAWKQLLYAAAVRQ
jgi:FkbM family methyltransferase